MKRMKSICKTLILIIFVMLFTSYISVSANEIKIKGVDVIYSNPGEDCSREVTISWHAEKSQSKLVYTLASDPEFAEATEMTVTGTLDNKSFIYFDVASFYKCTVYLTDLTPDTQYIYTVSCNNVKSNVYTFKTAGAGDFTFAYMSDVHAVPYDNLDLGMSANKRLQTVQTLLEQSTKVSGPLSFILTTGDEVWRGSQYSNWQEWSKSQYTTATNDYLWFSCPGNHEYYTQVTNSVWNYYPDKYSSNTSAIYSDPDYFYNTYFNAVKAVPKNGPQGIPSCYWSMYNNVLFICLDSMQANEYKQLSKIQSWFESVIIQNEGLYQYIIVYQHYPWFDFQTGSDKYARNWYKLFDKYGVDLALSGHMHGYLRTKSVYDGKLCEEEGKGTVYVVSPQIGDRPKEITENQNEELFASRQSTINYPDKSYSAMSTITVTKEGLTYKLLDIEGTVRDEFTIKARRSYSSGGNEKQEVVKSITASASLNSIIVDMKPSLTTYVESIKLSIDGKTYKCYPSKDKQSYVTANKLEANTLYDVKITVTYADGDTFIEDTKILTSDKYGLINKVNFNSEGGNMKVNITPSDNEDIKTYKLYVNDELFKENDKANTLFEVPLEKISFDTKYTLEAYNDSNTLIYYNDFYYDNYGDVNLDGSISKEDVNSLISYILSGYEFNDAAIKLLDSNDDGKVDIGDAYRILAYENKIVDAVVSKTYEVLYVDNLGKVITRELVSEGEDASLPEAKTITGLTFVGWSQSNYNIRRNVIIRAEYK